MKKSNQRTLFNPSQPQAKESDLEARERQWLKDLLGFDKKVKSGQVRI